MKLEVTLGIGFPTAQRKDVIEIDDRELIGLTESEIEDLFSDYWSDWSSNYIEGDLKVVEENQK